MQHNEILVGKVTAGEAVFMVACENLFHPVRDYLHRLKWDGQPRLDTWLSTYCGARGPEAQSSDVLAAVGRKFLVQAVARVMGTGVKADYILVLEGPQGYFKSTVFAVLGGEFYTDDLAAFGTKDAALGVAGMWFIELPELVRLRGANLNVIKSFLSRTVDRFRPPYGRHMMDVPRTNVFCGTTNDDEYLLDVTGNRRFWPVQVFEPADVDALRRDRDQLWAEAVHLYHHHEEFWIPAGSDLEKLLAGEQELRVVEDELEAPVMSWVSRVVACEMRDRESAKSTGVQIAEPSVTIYQILTLGLATGLGDPGAASFRQRELGPRIGRILRKHGWRRYKRGPRGSRQYQYHPPIGWDWQAVLAMDPEK
jgi:predicted P-loop ATPase